MRQLGRRIVLGRSLLVQHGIACLFSVMAVSCFIGWWPAVSAVAAVYECKGNNGSKILTDRPKGLRGCVLIETLAPSPSGKSAHASESQMLPPRQDDQAFSAIPLPEIPQLPPHPAPLEPTQPDRQPGQPSTSSRLESQPCPPSINPLNPLARDHCSPEASQSDQPTGATQEP
jgi:hypothetical protein